MFTKPEADVLVLGTYHMSNPGRDMINFVADDVLAPHRQRELAEIVESLARFRPTKVCVEVPPHRQAQLDEEFNRFLAGTLDERRDEVAQIAFPLARAAGLERLHAIDDHTPMRWDGLESYFAAHPDDDARFKAWAVQTQQEVDAASRELAAMPIRRYLKRLNKLDALRRDAAFYVDVAGLGALGEHGGADMLASWYERNIKIFSNLAGITEPGDRIFVLFGSGHVPILLELLELSSRHRVEDVGSYL